MAMSESGDPSLTNQCSVQENTEGESSKVTIGTPLNVLIDSLSDLVNTIVDNIKLLDKGVNDSVNNLEQEM